jgi:predicted DNA-binding transcriptional regulator AlpA
MPKISEASAAANVAAVAASDPPRLIDKNELLRRLPFTFPTIWKWMREGTFPRSRDTGGKTTWLESEVSDWIRNRPNQVLKGDDKKIKATS